MSVSKFHEFIPKSFQYLRSGYSFSTFRKDFLAGVTVGIIALPLAMAFAIAGLHLPGLVIRHPEVVNKTFPTFWEVLRSLG